MIQESVNTHKQNGKHVIGIMSHKSFCHVYNSVRCYEQDVQDFTLYRGLKPMTVLTEQPLSSHTLYDSMCRRIP